MVDHGQLADALDAVQGIAGAQLISTDHELVEGIEGVGSGCR